MRIIHVYPGCFESVYPKYLDRSLPPDAFDEEIVCNTDLEVRYLAGMHEMGDRCTLLYPRRFRLPEKSFTHRNGYEVRRFPIRLFERVPGRIRGAIMPGMLRYIRAEKPDVVHFHGIYAGGYFPINMFYLTVRCCRKLGIPIFGWYHIGQLEAKRGRYPLVRGLYRAIRIHTLRQLTGINSINHQELDRLFNPSHPEYYGVDFSGIPHRVSQNTFDPRMFSPVSRDEARAATGLDPSKRYLLMVARLFPQKGLHLLINILPKLRERYPNVHLLVIGEFIEEAYAYRDEIRQAIRQANLGDAVTFLGRVEHHQGLQHYYAAAEAFVLPTYMDSFAAVNIEALACGTPVISTDREEIPYYLKPGVGIVVPQRDEERLFDAVDEVLSGRFRFDKSESQRILAHYDYRTAAASLREWYQEVARIGEDV